MKWSKCGSGGREIVLDLYKYAPETKSVFWLGWRGVLFGVGKRGCVLCLKRMRFLRRMGHEGETVSL